MHTSDEAELFINDGFEFALGDAVYEKYISWVTLGEIRITNRGRTEYVWGACPSQPYTP